MKYPIYRKYSNNKSYFKILDESHFEETQVIGCNFAVYQFEAKILPDRNFIQDMVSMQGGGWVEISPEEHADFISDCKQEYNRVN